MSSVGTIFEKEGVMRTQKIAPAAAKPRTTQQKIDATEAAVGSVQDAVALLKGDHRKVEALFEQYEGADSATEKTGIAKEICKELITHTILEEQIFYPACR